MAKPGVVYRIMKRHIKKNKHLSPANRINKGQVQRALRKQRNQVSVLHQNTIGYLHKWLSNNELILTSSEDTVGVLPGWICTCEALVQDIENSDCDIHFVLSSKTMLKQLVYIYRQMVNLILFSAQTEHST